MRSTPQARKRLYRFHCRRPRPLFRKHRCWLEDGKLVMEISTWFEVYATSEIEGELVDTVKPEKYRRILLYYIDSIGMVVDEVRTRDEIAKEFAPLDVVKIGCTHRFDGHFSLMTEISVYLSHASIFREKLKLLIAD